MREHDGEPIPGLPEVLPRGERILWQGAPGWWNLAKSALHWRGVAVYLAIIVLWGVTSAIANGDTASNVAIFALKLTALASAALGALAFYAWRIARTTLYTITNRRVVMRFGVALPITLNIPLALVRTADLRINRDGSGDIPLSLAGDKRQSLVVLWPHVRPWHTAQPEPMLRSITNAQAVAAILGSALRAVATERQIRVEVARPVRLAPTGGIEQTVAA